MLNPVLPLTTLPTTPSAIKEYVLASIADLGSIPNAIFVHNPHVPEEGKLAEFWTILEDLVYDGTLNGCSLAVSNFRPQDIEEIMKGCRIPPVLNRLFPSFAPNRYGTQRLI